MELACLASKQASSAGPFLGPRASGVPKSKKMLPRYPGWFSATLSGTAFFSVGPPPVRNGDLVVFWPVLGRGHLEKFRDWAKNRKTQFPGARGPEIGKTCYHAIRDGCLQLFWILRFARPDPEGRPLALPFGNPGRGLKTECPGGRGPEIEKKMLPRYSEWVSVTFLRFTF